MFKMQREAAFELLQRYKAHFAFAWSQREAMDPPQRLPHEIEFLPAALSLQEKPVHPVPHIAMGLILGFALLALVWSIFGKVDIVATANGKIIPDDRTKVIQPLETAVIKAIRVHEGQAVRAGDVLVELDATGAQADSDRTRGDWQQAKLDAARAHAMLDALRSRHAEATMNDPMRGADPQRFEAAQRFLDGEYAEYRAKYEQLDAEVAQHRAELNATRENMEKLQETLPIATQRAQDLQNLLVKNYIARHDYLDKKQALIEMQHDFDAAKSKLNELDAVIVSTMRRQAALTAETRRNQLDKLHKAKQKIWEYHQEFIKANDLQKSMTLVAPVSGTVQQLAVHTIGGVVTPAQQLMVIVPRKKKLEVEAFIQNKDIGFVDSGQEAQIKVETFPYTKYGVIHGKVLHVSSDAIQVSGGSQKNTQHNEHSIVAPDNIDMASGLMYSALVQLNRSTMHVANKTINLSPGMAVTVEINTGKRRLIDYFLSPLLQYKDESLRER